MVSYSTISELLTIPSLSPIEMVLANIDCASHRLILLPGDVGGIQLGGGWCPLTFHATSAYLSAIDMQVSVYKHQCPRKYRASELNSQLKHFEERWSLISDCTKKTCTYLHSLGLVPADSRDRGSPSRRFGREITQEKKELVLSRCL